MCRSRWSRRRSASTSACVVTSSALVASSASSRRGSMLSAAAITTRCSIPPESWCGYARSTRSMSSSPTSSNNDAIRSRAFALAIPCTWTSRSVAESPMRRTGLSVARGSWKIMAASADRTFRTAARSSATISYPQTVTVPDRDARSGVRRSAALAVVDLPEPDSPTSPTVSPSATSRDTPRRISREPTGVGTDRWRSSIANNMRVTSSRRACRKGEPRRHWSRRPRSRS